MFKEKFTAYLISFAFVMILAAGMISNFSMNIFLLKAASSIFLFILIYAEIRLNKTDIIKLLKENNPRTFLILTGLFTGYLLLALIYSSDANYGLQKVLNFLICAVAAMLAFYYMIVTHTKERLRIIINSFIIITILSVAYILIDYPFEQGNIYQFKPEKWSHVIYGRVAGLFAISVLAYSFTLKEVKQTAIYGAAAGLSAYGIYLSALRSAIVASIIPVIIFVFVLVYKVILNKEAKSRKQIAGIAAGMVTLVILIWFFPGPGIIEERIGNLAGVENLEFGGDEPISSRLEALRISKELFFEYPVFGTGFGGFKAYNEFTEVIKYPHNIFVEMAVEGGVVGLLVISVLLLILFISVFRYSFLMGLIACYGLILALFSKDVSSQTVLWIFMAFAGLGGKGESRVGGAEWEVGSNEY